MNEPRRPESVDRTGRAAVRRVLLVGFMAAGKSAVGERLAERLGWDFVDVDGEIAAGEGRSVAQIFARDGEDGFRMLEAEATRRALRRDGVVIATGGGWPAADPAAWRALPQGTMSVWLVVSVAEALRRADAEGSERRPLLARTDARAAAAELLEARSGAYRVATLHVDTEGRSVEELVDQITVAVAPPREPSGHRDGGTNGS
ncbi:MAG: shikimate kinase [Gemmatimonadota bacterium]